MRFKRKNELIQGFSLVEMLIAMAILGIMSVLMMAGYAKMNNQFATTNLAYDIALVFRQAEVYSASAKGSAGLHSTVENTSGNDIYGVRFASLYDKINNISGENKFVLFSSSDNDGQSTNIDQYRCGKSKYLSDIPTDLLGCENSDEYDSTYSVSGRSRIKSFCAVNYNGSKDCVDFEIGQADILYVDTIFYGPFTDSRIKSNIGENYYYLEITVVSSYDSSYERRVLVYKTGQIDVR